MCMNLMEVLLFQDRQELMKLLNESYEEKINVNSKRELIEILYPRLTNREKVTGRFQSLSTNAQKLTLYLCFDKKLFNSKEELHGIVPNIDKNQFLSLIEQLTLNGILFVYKNGNYVIPNQIKKEIIESIQRSMIDHSFILPSLDVEEKELTIIHDLFVFIDYVCEKPLSLTKVGTMYKKDFQGIMKQFKVQEQLPNEQWRFGYGRRFSQYPDRFSLLYDYCYSKGWIKESNNQLITTSKVEELYDMRINELLQNIVSFWHKLYKRPIPTIGLLYELLLSVLKDGEGIEEEFLVSFFRPFVFEYYFDSTDDIITKRFLNMLVFLDIVIKRETEFFQGYTVGPSKHFLK